MTDDYTRLSPLRREFKLAPGRITKVDFHFPAGCAGLVGARVLRGGFQLWPLTAGQWIVTDDFTPTMPETFLLDERPYSLTFEGYNEDTANNHTITVAVAVDISVDYVKELVEIVSEGFPSLKDTLVERLEPLREAAQSVVGLLEEGVLPSLQEVLQLLREEKESKVSKMTFSELTIL